MKRVLVYTVTTPDGCRHDTTEWAMARSFAEMVDRPGAVVLIDLSHRDAP